MTNTKIEGEIAMDVEKQTSTDQSLIRGPERTETNENLDASNDSFIQLWTTTGNREDFANRFSRLPEEVRNGSYRIGLLSVDIWKKFLNMSWSEPHEFWIAMRGDECVGRIGAKVCASDPFAGYIGFLEFNPGSDHGVEVAKTLIESAVHFLQEHDVEQIYAPVQFSTWFPYRYRESEEDRRFFAWEPVNPPAYLEAFEAAGFEEDAAYNSTAYGELDCFLAKMKPAYEAALSAGYIVRSFDREHWLDREVPKLHRLSQEAFCDNYLFEPISLEVFASLYVHIADKAQQFSKMVVAPDGKEAGFLFGFMDRHRDEETGKEERYFVIKSLAVVPDERGRGLSNAMVYEAVSDAVRAGAEYAVSALVRSGIQSESYEKKGRYFWRHRYKLLIYRI